MRKNLHFIPIIITTISCVAYTQNPVYFADANLKAAVEEKLGISDPNSNDMLTLIKFDASERGIIDLTGLEYSKNMTQLLLNHNQIEDISALSTLINLNRLVLHHNQISDISAVRGLIELDRLDLHANQISDISAISGLTNLTQLVLTSNQILDVSVISGLTNLVTLFLGNNQISDISAVRNLTNLATLALGYNQIVDISAFSGLTKLTGLDLSINQIVDISSLSSLINLQSLSLWKNKVSDISALSGMTDLTWLSLADNKVSDISAMAELRRLERLYLFENQICDTTDLSDLVMLEWLDLKGNHLTNLTGLTKMKNLVRLELQDNSLEDREVFCEQLPVIKMNNPTAEIIHDPNPYNCQNAEIITELDYQQALEGLNEMRSAVVDLNGLSYYYCSKRNVLNHPETLLSEIDLLRENADSNSKEFCYQVASSGLISWDFSTLTQVANTTLPSSLVDDLQVNLSACIGETEPVGFYLTNLTSYPLTVEIWNKGDIDNLNIQWVTTHEGLPYEEYKGPTPELIARIVPLLLGKYLLIPPYESRQVLIEVDTRGFDPGLYTDIINISASSSGVLNPEFASKWIPGMSLEDLTNIEPLHFPALSKTIFVDLQVHPVVLPAKARFGVYTWNASGTESPEYIRLLADHKVNFFALTEPNFRIVDDRIELDLTEDIKRNILATKPRGQFISIYGFVQRFNRIAKEEYGIDFMQGDYTKYLKEYFQKYIALLKENGLDYDDYTLQLWDEPLDMETFHKIKQVCDLLHGVNPQVRFMVDPLCTLQDGYELIAEHISMWIPHNGMVYDCYTDIPLFDMVQRGFDPSEWGRDNNRAIQWFLHTQRIEHGAYCMMYSQYGGNSNLCPVGYFRHWPWKMWWMRFDGITFWTSWYLTNGYGSEFGINKGLVGWREGVEDIQHLYLLKDAIDLMKEMGVPQDQIANSQKVLDQCTDMGVKWDWWCTKPLEAEAAMNQSRILIINELQRLWDDQLLPFDL